MKLCWDITNIQFSDSAEKRAEMWDDELWPVLEEAHFCSDPFLNEHGYFTLICDTSSTFLFMHRKRLRAYQKPDQRCMKFPSGSYNNVGTLKSFKTVFIEKLELRVNTFFESCRTPSMDVFRAVLYGSHIQRLHLRHITCYRKF